ncbi:tannase/feruloyl esterase family alpha/beta hydrolase [Shewanella youngdeokensis]|uniref:Tannase/feruloyl esterase family alpha/beta hydrolase n=1 Tax=Shewanella youngdeokensis TaxID=2999068 RepID=A0ABZ0K0G1_9GAMM|nr:tannase/feruloyl esterase family alpha/beta hydrolase [Shewanella sp. DAU334]
MKKQNLLLSFLISPLFLAMYGCNSSDDAKQTTLPVLEAATPATLSVCEGIKETFSYSDTTITSVERVEAGIIKDYNTPAHCIVTGYMNERTGKGYAAEAEETEFAIGFEMRLPIDWNGRFYYQANGGLDGSVKTAVGDILYSGTEDSAALSKGFAVISSDAGHPSPTPTFGLDPQARKDYGYNAVAELTPMAKDLIKTAYGKQPDRSYFGGCSNGGRHTMVASTRFSEMYDGFLVANPGFHLPQAAVSQMYGVQQYASLVDTSTATDADILSVLESAITVPEFAVVAAAVVAQCDALDGAADGMVNAIMACQEAFDFDRDVKTCDGERDGTCLTAEQKTVFANVMKGPRHSETDAEVYTKFLYDAGMGGTGYTSWEYEMAMTRDPSAVAFIFTTTPTPFNYRSNLANFEFANGFSMDTDAEKIFAIDDEYTEAAMTFMPPVDETDLSAMRARGAKMMVIHGTSDPVFSVNDTINWFEGVQDENQGNADEFARLYLVPGMNHCGSGPSTEVFDMLDDLVEWVEEGMQPQSVIATVKAGSTDIPADWSATRTRPLCPYPAVVTYSGTGSIEDAANFSCVSPE